METYYLHGLSLLATYQNFSYSLQFIGKQLTYELCIPRLFHVLISSGLLFACIVAFFYLDRGGSLETFTEK